MYVRGYHNMAIQSRIQGPWDATTVCESNAELYETYPDGVKYVQVIDKGNGLYEVVQIYDDGVTG